MPLLNKKTKNKNFVGDEKKQIREVKSADNIEKAYVNY